MSAHLPARSRWLDSARGLAVVAMVIYHVGWDLSHFGLIETDVAFATGWRRFAQAIAASFLVISGISLALATQRGIRMQHLLKRLGVIAGAALLVTIGSYLVFPDQFIFFGILHCLTVAGLIGLGARRLPWAALLLLGALVLALPSLVSGPAFNGRALIWLGLGSEVPLTNDFVPVFPWLGWYLLGLGGGRWWAGRDGGMARGGSGGILARLGRWSLPIYLIHQPLLFALFTGAGTLGWFTPNQGIKEFVRACSADCGTAGAAPEVCRAACSCVARTLRDRPVWPRVVSGKLLEQDADEMSMVGRRCFSAAQPATIPAERP